MGEQDTIPLPSVINTNEGRDSDSVDEESDKEENQTVNVAGCSGGEKRKSQTMLKAKNFAYPT